MKKITLYSILSLAACILICSCQSNLSITKRHYTNGYYVDFSKNNKQIAENKTESNPIQPKEVTLALSVGAITSEPIAKSNDSKLNEVSTPAPKQLVINKLEKAKNVLAPKSIIGNSESKKPPISLN